MGYSWCCKKRKISRTVVNMADLKIFLKSFTYKVYISRYNLYIYSVLTNKDCRNGNSKQKTNQKNFIIRFFYEYDDGE